MNEFATRFTDDNVLDLVIMNDDLCFHKAVFIDPGAVISRSTGKRSFAMPTWTYNPPTENYPMKVEVNCPVCYKKYPEASKRLRKEIQQFYKDLNTKENIELCDVC